MTSSVNSVADVVNIALRRVGYSRRVGDMYEGSVASKLALDLYSQTRDEVLRQQDWGFANRNLSLTLLKSAPAGGYVSAPWNGTSNPLLPYLFEYAYPSDCMRLLYLVPPNVPLPTLDPHPVEFKVANDAFYTPPQRVILSNLASAVAVYTGQVTDMTTWEPSFVAALTTVLAKRFLTALKNGNELVALVKPAAEDAVTAEAEAEEQHES